MPISYALACAILAVVAFTLWEARQDAWAEAERYGRSIAQVLRNDISRNIELYDLSLQRLRDAIVNPDIAGMAPRARQWALFDRAATGRHLGAMGVLDTSGNVLINSRSTDLPRENFADRDYFQVHLRSPDVELYVSRPFKSRISDGADTIALSRRLPDKDGKFQGVVVGSIRLGYFRDLFQRLQLGSKDVISLTLTDGTVLMREPSLDGAGDIGLEVGNIKSFERTTIIGDDHSQHRPLKRDLDLQPACGRIPMQHDIGCKLRNRQQHLICDFGRKTQFSEPAPECLPNPSDIVQRRWSFRRKELQSFNPA